MYGIAMNGRFQPTFCKNEYVMCNGFTSYKGNFGKYTAKYLDNFLTNQTMLRIKRHYNQYCFPKSQPGFASTSQLCKIRIKSHVCRTVRIKELKQ